MEVYIIGYYWCKHYKNSLESLKKTLKNVHTVQIRSETPNRMLIKNITSKIIGQRHCIGTPDVTSPQIVVCIDDKAVCIPGEEELNDIGPENVAAFVREACSLVH